MSSDIDSIIERLGPAVFPFERSNFSREVLPGEDVIFLDYIISLEAGQVPADCLRCDLSDITSLPADRKYLWVIDQQGLRIIREMTPNPLALEDVFVTQILLASAKRFRVENCGSE